MNSIQRFDYILQTLSDNKITITCIRSMIKLYITAEVSKNIVTHSTLAALMGMTGAAITSIVNTIENLGYAARYTNPSDRRSTLVKLTPLGIEIVEWLENEVYQ